MLVGASGNVLAETTLQDVIENSTSESTIEIGASMEGELLRHTYRFVSHQSIIHRFPLVNVTDRVKISKSVKTYILILIIYHRH